MAMVVGDVLFNRDGRPVIIKSQDHQTGQVTLEKDNAAVRNEARHSILNGLPPATKTELHETLDAVAKEGSEIALIDSLYSRIKEMKAAGADPRLIRYLEAELQHRMVQAQYAPHDFAFDKFVVGG